MPLIIRRMTIDLTSTGTVTPTLCRVIKRAARVMFMALLKGTRVSSFMARLNSDLKGIPSRSQTIASVFFR